MPNTYETKTVIINGHHYISVIRTHDGFIECVYPLKKKRDAEDYAKRLNKLQINGK